MKLSLVVPCYNEQDNVRAFYDAAVNAFLGCGYEYELVMVNDGSRDNTGIELKSCFMRKEKKHRSQSFSFHVILERKQQSWQE